MPQKSEFVCHKGRFVHHILCASLFISRDFYAIRPLVLYIIAYFGSIFFASMGVGVVKIVFNHASWRGAEHDGSYHANRKIQERSGDPNPQYFSKSTAVQMGAYCRTNGGVLQYKREAYCGVSLSSKLRSQESAAIQMGGVLPYKLGVYCRTFWTSCRGWGFRNIAQRLLFHTSKHK